MNMEIRKSEKVKSSLVGISTCRINFFFTLSYILKVALFQSRVIHIQCLALFWVVVLLINNLELSECLPEGFYSGKKTTKVMHNPWLQLESKLPLLSAVYINISKSRVHIYLLQCCGGQTSRVACG